MAKAQGKGKRVSSRIELDENFFRQLAAQNFQVYFKEVDWEQVQEGLYSKLYNIAREIVLAAIDYKQFRIEEGELFRQWKSYFVVKERLRKTLNEVEVRGYFETEDEAREFIFWKDPESSEGWIIEKVEQIESTAPQLVYEGL